MECMRWSAHSGTHTTEHAWNAACFALGCVVSVRTVIVVKWLLVTLAMYWNASFRHFLERFIW